MIEFQQLQLKDIAIIKPYLYTQNSRTCDYTIGGLFMWRNYFQTEFCLHQDTLLLKVTYLNGETAFSFPVGKHSKEALKELAKYCEENKVPLEFCTISQDHLEELKHTFQTMEVIEERDWFDYLYEAESMKHFSGKKLNKIRNHVNRFHNTYANHTFQRITKQDIKDILDFYKQFEEQRVIQSGTMTEESLKVYEVLEHYDEYNLLGGVLRVDDHIVGFSLGEIVNDTLFVHIEKANVQYKGVYQKIVSSFVQEFADSQVKYVNREEDVGDEGLRKSKLAYRPIKLLPKYTVRVL